MLGFKKKYVIVFELGFGQSFGWQLPLPQSQQNVSFGKNIKRLKLQNLKKKKRV